MKKFCSAVGAFRRKLEPSPPLKVLFTVLLALCTGFELTAAVKLINLQSLHATLLWLGASPMQVLGATLLFGLAICAIGLLVRNLFVGGLLVAVVGVILGFVNHFKVLITNVPLSFTDLALAGRVGGIAKLNASSITFQKDSIAAVLVTVLWLLVLLFLAKPLALRWKQSLIAGGGSVAAFLLLMVLFAETCFYIPLGAPVSVTMGQARANSICGEVLGLWRGALFQWKVAPRGDFSEAAMADTLARVQTIVAEDRRAHPAEKAPPLEAPNVIMVLSESFFDVTALPNLTYSGDPLSNFHALQETTISGTFHTRTLGQGTCNIELEVLTGVNAALFPQPTNLFYQDPEEIKRITPLPKLLQERGYYTALFHTFNDQIYHRKPLFEAIGFEDLFFSSDFAAVDSAAAAAPNYYTYLLDKISGGAYSDDYLADLLIERYKQKTHEGPVFLYGISMENHAPYGGDKYGGKYEFPFRTNRLTPEGEDALRGLTQGVANADRSLQKLVDYFSACGEPTIIVFYGDHRPGLGLSDGTSIYSQLGVCASPKGGEWTPEEMETLYSTDYLIWANDPTLLPAEPGTRVDTSSNYLGLDLLEMLGEPLPLFWQYLRPLSRISTMWTDEYYLSAKGTVAFSPFFANMDEERPFYLMKRLIYDTFFGNHFSTEAINNLG